MNTRRHEKLDLEKKGDYKLVLDPYVEDQGNKIPVIGFNPIDSYLTELRVRILLKNYFLTWGNDFCSVFRSTMGTVPFSSTIRTAGTSLESSGTPAR